MTTQRACSACGRFPTEQTRTVLVANAYRYLLCDPCYAITLILISAGQNPTLEGICRIRERSNEP